MAAQLLLDNSGFDQNVDTGDTGGGSPINVDVGEVSGGSTSTATAQAAEQIEEFASEGGGVLAIVYGEHLIAGHLAVHKFTAGSPNTSLIIVLLGEGQGDKGTRGEWNAALAVYYAGELLSVSPNGSTAGYRFFNGSISTAIGSGPQQVDAFLPNGLAYSGTAGIAVKLSDAVANAEDRPDKLRGRYQGRRVHNYNRIGNVIDYGYFPFPGQVAPDRIRAYYEHKFPKDLAKAFKKFQDKIDWDAWTDWAANCTNTISWNDGTTTSDISRFECHLVLTGDATLAEALDQICATAGAFWQDDGEQIIFLSPTDRDPVHHFDESNISQGSFRIQPRDLRERPNYFVAEFRDFDDEFLGLSSVEVRRDALIAQVGENKSTRAFPTMKQSQAQRLLERQARLEADNPDICALVGDETSIHILPGDFVTVSHSISNWTYQRCLVLSVNLLSAEESPDVCEFTLQAVKDSLYSDRAHTERQEPLAP